MRIRLLLLLPCLAAAIVLHPVGLSAQDPRAEIMDGIAAVVNGDVITISQLRELTGAREMALRDALRGDELVNEVKRMREAALRDLIDRQLVIQEFKKKEFSIPPYLVDDRVQSIIRQEFGGDRAAFVRTLQAQGYSLTRFKEIEKEKIIVQAMRQANIKEDFITTPRQIQAFYDKNKHAYTSPEEVKLRMIVLREGGLPASDVPEDIPSAGDKKALAGEIRQKLVEGGDFERMAAMYSEDPSTADLGGDWGWVQRDTLNQQLTSVAFSLGAGQVSPVVQMGDSYYILYVEDRKPARTRPLAEVKDEIERNLIQEERQKAAERWLETLRKAAYIKILV